MLVAMIILNNSIFGFVIFLNALIRRFVSEVVQLRSPNHFHTNIDWDINEMKARMCTKLAHI
jgi:hypothetical protein